MHKIAICEDDPLDSAELQNILDDYEHYSSEDLNVKNFPDAESMLDYFTAEHYSPEILMMDIFLPGISGIEAVRILRESGFSGEVIFTTSSPNYALTAYEFSARQYFVKPLTPQKVFAVLQEIMHSRRDFIMIRSRKAVRRIMFSDILYCETCGKYQVIHSRSEEISFRVSAHEMQRLVPPHSKYFYCIRVSIFD